MATVWPPYLVFFGSKLTLPVIFLKGSRWFFVCNDQLATCSAIEKLAGHKPSITDIINITTFVWKTTPATITLANLSGNFTFVLDGRQHDKRWTRPRQLPPIMVNNLKNIAMLAHALVTHNHVLHVFSSSFLCWKAPGQQRKSQCLWLGVSFGYLNLAPLGGSFLREQANNVDDALDKLTNTTRRNTKDFVASQLSIVF